MDRIGIDIGTTKTVIYTSRSNGTVITDEFDKREIATVMELTTPKRSFGKACSSDSSENILKRERFFFQNILDSDAQNNTFIFLEHLHRLISAKGEYKNAQLSIPEYFCEKERIILKAIADASSLKVCGFVTHLTSIGAYAALLKSDVPETFMVIDFGSHKTCVGVFRFSDFKCTPVERFCIKSGATDFDEIIYQILVKKHSLPDSKLTRERIYLKLGKLKASLNTIDFGKDFIYSDSYEKIDVLITKEEFVEAAKPALDTIRSFLHAVFEKTKFAGHIEIVGKNYQNAFIQEIVREMYKNIAGQESGEADGVLKNATLNLSLHSSESAAHGACLALAVNSKNIKYRIEEIVGREISVKIMGEEVEPTVIFRRESLQGNPVNIKYNRKDMFDICLLENGNEIGVVRNVPAGKVVITAAVNAYGLVEIVESKQKIAADEESAKGNAGYKPVELVLEKFQISEESISRMREIESEFIKLENEVKLAGDLRNETERVLDNLVGFAEKNFPGLLSAAEIDRVNEICDEYYDQTVTKVLKTEEANRNEVFEKLDFVEAKFADQESRMKKDIEEMKLQMNEFLNASDKMTRSKRELIRFDYQFKKALESIKISIATSDKLDMAAYHKLISGFKKTMADAMVEMAQLEESERLAAASKDASDAEENKKASDEENAAHDQADDESAKDSKCGDSADNEKCSDTEQAPAGNRDQQ